MRDTELYRPTPTKGLIKTGQRLICFDAVQRCRAEACPIHDACPYAKSGNCNVIMKYLDAVRDSILDEIEDRMTQGLLNKISLHLVPLFHQLIKLQIEAYAVVDPIYRTAQGQYKVHPIFKEIRSIINAIESTQRSMGMDLEYSRAMTDTMGKLRGIKGATPSDPERGDPDYFERWKRMNQSDVFPDGPASNVSRAKRHRNVEG